MASFQQSQLDCANPEQDDPRVSVIVPNYNHARFLPERLDSILNQTYQDFELILLDDCSTDNSVEVLQRYADHPKVSHFIVNETNSGSPFAQWKKGIELAKGEFIWIAESDDVAAPEFLDHLVFALDDTPSAGIAAAASQFIGADGTISGKLSISNRRHRREIDRSNRCRFKGIDFISHHMQWGNALPNASGLLLRTSAVRSVNLPIEMRYCGDVMTWLRILANHDLIYSFRLLNFWRCHQQTTRATGSTWSPGVTGSYVSTIKRFDYLQEMIDLTVETYGIIPNRWTAGPLNAELAQWRQLQLNQSDSSPGPKVPRDLRYKSKLYNFIKPYHASRAHAALVLNSWKTLIKSACNRCVRK